VIGLGALLAVHVTLAVFALWQWVQEIELPLWLASLISIPALGAAAFLVWGIVIAVRRFRAFTADRAS
jgi:Zn-dependent protease with chaperone function